MHIVLKGAALCLSLLISNPIAGDATDVAPISSFTITDGSTSFTADNLFGQRLGSSGGAADLITQNGTSSQLDHMFQNFFWYRGPGDTREYALSNQSLLSVGGNVAEVIYDEPFNNGGTPNALHVFLTYRLSDLSVPSDRPHPFLHIVAAVTNQTLGFATVQFFSYNDLDMGSTSGNDTAAVGGANSRFLQVVTDSQPHTQATYAANAVPGSVAFFHYQIGPYSSIRDLLANNVTNDLNDTTTAFGPGDYTGANQWLLFLGSGETARISITIDLTMLLCATDVDRDGQVNVNDLLSVISAWGACP